MSCGHIIPIINLEEVYSFNHSKGSNINCCLFSLFPTPLPPSSFILHSVAIVIQTVDGNILGIL